VLFGGADGGVDQDRTWAWTGTDWNQLLPTVSPFTFAGYPNRENLSVAKALRQ